MGNIKKQRKKYNLPFKKWDKTRADEEDTLVHEFGLANKKEVWRANAKISQFRKIARTLFTKTGPIAEQTKKELIARAHKLGLLSVENSTLDDLLGLTTRNILERRLQTIVLKKGFANTQTQARQFIAHSHVLIGERVVTIPGYLVKKDEEAAVSIMPKSALSDPNHPARMTPQKKEEARLLEQIKKKKAEEPVAAEGVIEPKDVEEVEKVPEDE